MTGRAKATRPAACRKRRPPPSPPVLAVRAPRPLKRSKSAATAAPAPAAAPTTTIVRAKRSSVYGAPLGAHVPARLMPSPSQGLPANRTAAAATVAAAPPAASQAHTKSLAPPQKQLPMPPPPAAPAASAAPRQVPQAPRTIAVSPAVAAAAIAAPRHRRTAANAANMSNPRPTSDARREALPTLAPGAQRPNVPLAAPTAAAAGSAGPAGPAPTNIVAGMPNARPNNAVRMDVPRTNTLKVSAAIAKSLVAGRVPKTLVSSHAPRSRIPHVPTKPVPLAAAPVTAGMQLPPTSAPRVGAPSLVMQMPKSSSTMESATPSRGMVTNANIEAPQELNDAGVKAKPRKVVVADAAPPRRRQGKAVGTGGALEKALVSRGPRAKRGKAAAQPSGGLPSLVPLTVEPAATASKTGFALLRDGEPDPAVFIKSYLAERKMEDSAVCDELASASRAAENAREAFKARRSVHDDAEWAQKPPAQADPVRKARQHDRRLCNNRRSAAATRVYNVVYDAEAGARLNEVWDRHCTLANTLQQKTQQADFERRRLERARARIATLERLLAEPDPSSEVTTPASSQPGSGTPGNSQPEGITPVSSQVEGGSQPLGNGPPMPIPALAGSSQDVVRYGAPLPSSELSQENEEEKTTITRPVPPPSQPMSFSQEVDQMNVLFPGNPGNERR